jgi:hypothetical protein
MSCSHVEHSSLCFCRSTYRLSAIIDLFVAQVSLSQCTTSNERMHLCRQGRFYPSSTHITQLVPNLVNHSHCFDDLRCLNALRHNQRCKQCQIISSSFRTENTSYVISTTKQQLPADSCFYLCDHDQSCGFLCFDRRVTMNIQCDHCRGRRQNVTCR